MPPTPTTATGVSEFVVVVLPNPKSPSMLEPQQSTPPVVSAAQADSTPTLTEATPERKAPVLPTSTTATGVGS